jgi:hypothetical protein
MNRSILLTLSIFFSLFSSTICSKENDKNRALNFTAKEKKSIRARQAFLKKDAEWFTDEEQAALAARGDDEIIRALLLNEALEFEDKDDVIDFAKMIADSGFAYASLEPRFTRYLRKDELLFTALRKAIEREGFHRWHEDIVMRVKTSDDSFVQEIDRMLIAAKEKQRVLNVYATCIASFANPVDRALMRPNICDASDDYRTPRHQKHPVSLRSMSELNESAHFRTYRRLIDAAIATATDMNLSTFERVAMAKCIAEQSLRFFFPSSQPVKALHKHRQLSRKAPEEAFFMRTGVCSNFSGISKNVSDELGLAGKIHLAKKGVHVYLEFEEQGEWFHTHPFNSKSQCDIMRFMNAPKSLF